MEDQPTNNALPVHPKPNRTPGWMATALILFGVFLMVAAVSGVVLQNWAQTTEESSELVKDEPASPLRVGARMVDFSLPDLKGKSVKLSDYSGRMVLINAWATWCPPCRAEMPDLQKLFEQHQSSGFVILAVNAGETRYQAATFASQLGLQFPILLDQDEKLMDTLGIRDYPTSILVDGKGTIRAVHVGMFTADALQQEIEPLIK